MKITLVIAFIAVLLSSCEKDTLNRSNQKDDSVITLAQVRNTWIHESKYSDDIKEYDSLQAKTLPFVELFWDSTKPIIRMMFQLGYCVTDTNMKYSYPRGWISYSNYIVWMIGESDSTVRVISCNSEDERFVDTLISTDNEIFNELLQEKNNTIKGYSSVNMVDFCFLDIWNNGNSKSIMFICFSDFWYLNDMESLIRLENAYQYYSMFSSLQNIGIGKRPKNRYLK